MSSCFRSIGESKIQHALRRAEALAYFSEYNSCVVVIFECEKCERWYEEEKEAAKAKIRRAEQMLCISCDSDAEERSIAAMRRGKVRLWV